MDEIEMWGFLKRLNPYINKTHSLGGQIGWINFIYQSKGICSNDHENT